MDLAVMAVMMMVIHEDIEENILSNVVATKSDVASESESGCTIFIAA